MKADPMNPVIAAWFPGDRAKEEEARLRAEIASIEDPMRRAVKALAEMTRNAPSYGVCVLPFAVAHLAACEVLAELQDAGIEEAR
jgi:hypothetical protein